MWIKPREGHLVRRPGSALGGYLPAEGCFVPDDDSYWHPLINWGDVVVIDPPPAAAPAAVAEPEQAERPEHEGSDGR